MGLMPASIRPLTALELNLCVAELSPRVLNGELQNAWQVDLYTLIMSVRCRGENVFLSVCTRSGEVRLGEVSGKPERDLLVRIRGPRAAWPAGMAGMMADPAEAIDHLRRIDGMAAAKTLQASLIALIAHATGHRISFLLGPQTEDAPPLLVALAPVA